MREVQHPNLVRLLDALVSWEPLPMVRDEPPFLCIVTEYLANTETLSQRIRQCLPQRLPLQLVERILQQLASALARPGHLYAFTHVTVSPHFAALLALNPPGCLHLGTLLLLSQGPTAKFVMEEEFKGKGPAKRKFHYASEFPKAMLKPVIPDLKQESEGGEDEELEQDPALDYEKHAKPIKEYLGESEDEAPRRDGDGERERGRESDRQAQKRNPGPPWGASFDSALGNDVGGGRASPAAMPMSLGCDAVDPVVGPVGVTGCPVAEACGVVVGPVGVPGCPLAEACGVADATRAAAASSEPRRCCCSVSPSRSSSKWWGRGKSHEVHRHLRGSQGALGRARQVEGTLHRSDVVHRDVWVENILIEKQSDKVTLLDLGCAERVQRPMLNNKLNIPYMSPEAAAGLSHGAPRWRRKAVLSPQRPHEP
eukprot:Skav228201  [mRNA]  locus=scaffold704:325551:340875:- [translate_table: standard]